MKTLFLPIVGASLMALLASCAPVTKSTSGEALVAAYNNFDLPASLPTNPSAVKVKVSTSNQMVYVMEGNRALMVMPVTVGTASTPTPKGSFRIFKKDHYHRANSHGFAYNGSQIIQTYLAKKPRGWSFKGTPMPYWCEFKANYGFHTGWMKHRPASHGCIRMHENLAPKFYRLVKVGTRVSIAHSQPEDATLGRNVPRPIDSSPLPDYPGSFMLSDKYFTKHKAPSYR